MSPHSILLVSLLSVTIWSCKGMPGKQGESKVENTVTPVTIVRPDTTTLAEKVTLSAISIYRLKTDVKAPINGYIIRSAIQAGSKIQRGQTLFVLETKEARSLGNTINKLDSTFMFSGINSVKSPVTGYITMLNHQPGDYVQDGEILAGIADKNSFGFMLNLPYEYHRLLIANQEANVQLPDGAILKGYVAEVMPSVDSSSQTQKIWLKVSDFGNIPENLMAKVQLIKKESTHLTLPKAAVFSDESQQKYWVMHLINDSVAVKISIEKGIENDSLVEIIRPLFMLTDSFIMQGGYGLADTAKVSVQK